MKRLLEEWFHRVRARIIAYDHAGISYAQHQAILHEVSGRLGTALEDTNSFCRQVARSLAQYLAQRAIRPTKNVWFAEIASAVLLPTMLGFWLIEGTRTAVPRSEKLVGARWLTSWLRYDVTPEIYHTPPELSEEPVPVAYTRLRYLRWADIGFLVRVYTHSLRLLRVPHLQWWFKIAKEIAWARAVMEQFPSDYALIADECNCGLSLLTAYANAHGTQVYVVQHGDLFFSVYTAFFETNRSYCWAEFYVELLKNLQARSDFSVYCNPSFMLGSKERALVESARGIGIFHPSFYTLTTPEERDAFATVIRTLAERYAVEVRPHPAYFHEYEAMAKAYGPNVGLAPVSQESAKQFALRHRLIIGTTSTALLESLMLGCEVMSVDGAMVGDVATYHFAYRMPNCTLSTLGKLEKDAVRLMEISGVQPVSR